MGKEPDYTVYKQTIEQLRSVTDTYRALTSDKNCDKKGIGFNRDGRFASLKLDLSFDSWKGYFGNSSCSRVIHFSDADLVRKAFVAYLNRHYAEIFAEMADSLEDEATVAKEARIAKLEAELESLRGDTKAVPA